MRSWLRRNWKRVVLLVAVGVAAATSSQSLAHRIADAVVPVIEQLEQGEDLARNTHLEEAAPAAAEVAR